MSDATEGPPSLRIATDADLDLLNALDGKILIADHDEVEAFSRIHNGILSEYAQTLGRWKQTFGIEADIALAWTKGTPDEPVYRHPSAHLTNTNSYYITFPLFLLEALLQRSFEIAARTEFHTLFPQVGLMTYQDECLQCVVQAPFSTFRMTPWQVAASKPIYFLLGLWPLLHEFGHIKNGHLLYLRELGGHASASIVEDAATKQESSPVKMALEFDADAFSANCIYEVLRDVGHHVWTCRQPGVLDLTLQGLMQRGECQDVFMIRDKHDTRSLYALTSYLAQRLFDNDIPTQPGEWGGTHPVSKVRAWTNMMHIMSVDLSLTEEEYAPFVQKVFNLVEGALSQHPMHRPERLLDYQDVAGRYSDYRDRVIGPAWNSLRDDLDRLKLGGRIASKHDLS